jgi:hypothetical protein
MTSEPEAAPDHPPLILMLGLIDREARSVGLPSRLDET